jgi:hypothetical protein
MTKITVSVDGLNRLQKLAEQYPETSEKYINAAITTSLTRILGAEKVEAPFGVSGVLRDNWRITPGRFTGTLESLAPYAAAVHEGTAPHMVPVDAITPWANKKGLNPWAVAKSIAKKGTKANPFLQRAVDSVEDGISIDFEKALQSTLDELTSLSDE